MAREVQDLQSAENGKLFAIFQPMINLRCGISEQNASRSFQHAAESRGAIGRIMAGNLCALQSVRRHPRFGFLRDSGGIEHVVEMAMREEDAANAKVLPTATVESVREVVSPAYEAAVDEVEIGSIPQDVKCYRRCAYRERIGRGVASPTLHPIRAPRPWAPRGRRARPRRSSRPGSRTCWR